MPSLFRSIFLALPLVAASAQAAIIIDDFDTNVNDRFANSGSFVANSFDLSGVGVANNARWATLISNNVIISAQHWNPASASSITFYETNDPGSASITRTVTSTQRIGVTDIWLGVLDQPVSSSYKIYDFATEPATSVAQFITTPYALQNAYLFGISPSAFPTTQDVAVGRNVLDGYYTDVDVNGTVGDLVTAEYNSSGDVNYVTNEAMLNSGDSGGPIFVDVGGDWVLVGTNWVVNNTQLPYFSGFTYLGNEAAAIQNFIDANAVVPEPAFIGLALGAMSLLVVVVGRRR